MGSISEIIPQAKPDDLELVNALLEAFKSLSRFDKKQSSLQTWLMRIAYHMALKHYRQSQKLVPIADAKQEWLENMSDDETDEILSDTSSDRLSLLERAVDQLKPDDQMLLSFYYFDDYSIKEISQITGHDGGYLRSRLQWIRKKLAVIIKQLENYERQ